MILEKKIPFYYIFNKIKYDIIVVFMVGFVTNLLTRQFNPLLPEMPLGVPALLGTAISILLSFKMNQSYDRWWEARKVWGAIVNDSRSFVIQLQSFLPSGNEAIRRMSYRQIAWCYSLSQSLRGLDATVGLDTLISETERSEIAKHNNKPLAILQLNAREIQELRFGNKLEVFTHLQLDNTLVRLCDSMGKAERINSTIFPSTYRQFLHFIIYLFIVTLSIALRQVNMIFEIPLLMFIAAAFFLIEKSAYHLQDPFKNRPSDVSITAISRTIEINIRQLLGDNEVPEPVKPEGFYIL
ncbi:bestrophin family ion channel [Segetibacter sp.]|jgi:putative membrane protein|uniref:bestrophin family protein n=1 Tax=Segetibacter sp. TaxID=2231182 RepID=UPI002615ECDC|nr:bestrophin family ion channel [Segetibacter sp.]